MSRPEKSPPPAGERIHLPGPSLQPVLIAVSLTMVLMGLVGLWFLTGIGTVILLAVIIRWVVEATREYRDLPAHHD